MQIRCTAPVVRLFLDCGSTPGLSNVFLSPQKEVTGVHVWRIGRPIHIISCMCGIAQSNQVIIEMFVYEIKDVSHAMWPGTIFHKPQGVHNVPLRFLDRYKFTKNVKIVWCSNQFGSKKWTNGSFGGNSIPNHYFFRMQGRWDCNIGVFGSPFAPVLFIDETIQVKKSFISKPNAA